MVQWWCFHKVHNSRTQRTASSSWHSRGTERLPAEWRHNCTFQSQKTSHSCQDTDQVWWLGKQCLCCNHDRQPLHQASMPSLHHWTPQQFRMTGSGCHCPHKFLNRRSTKTNFLRSQLDRAALMYTSPNRPHYLQTGIQHRHSQLELRSQTSEL